MNFSEKVHYLRRRKGLTQVQLAKLVNVSQGTIWLFEAGRRKPTPNTALQLARVLGVKEIDLMNDDRSVIS